MPTDYRQILLNLIGSLTLADHMGDASTDALEALKQIGIEPPMNVEREGPHGLGDWLARNHGVTTLYGTSLVSDDAD